jgi:GWxTD domain-containing protein
MISLCLPTRRRTRYGTITSTAHTGDSHLSTPTRTATTGCSSRTTGSTSGLTSSLPRLFLAGLFLAVALVPDLAGAQTGIPQLTVFSGPVVFNNPMYDSLAVVEFPFVLNRSELDFFRADTADTNYYSRVFAQVVLLSNGQTAIDSTNTYFSVKVSSKTEAAIPDYKLFNKLALKLRPGMYTARLTVIDVSSKRSKELYFGMFEVRKPVKDRINFSSPVLAYSIRFVGDTGQAGNDRMNQNGFRVLNNPLGLYGTSDSTAYLYAELYGLTTTAGSGKSIRIAIALLDSSDTPVRDFGFKTQNKPGRSTVIAQALDLSQIGAGRYSLRLIALDSSVNQADTSRVSLTIIAPLGAPSQTPGTADIWDSLSLEEKYNATYWFLTPSQREVLSRLTETGKASFLAQFWKENDLRNADHPINNRSETVQRYRYAIARYSKDLKKSNGWNTDRGRIYIIYGPPDDHKDVPAPRIGNPFAIWYYHTYKEGKLFVFEDRLGDNDYRLVHSNVNGEPYDKDWETRLKEDMLDVE